MIKLDVMVISAGLLLLGESEMAREVTSDYIGARSIELLPRVCGGGQRSWKTRRSEKRGV